jgi:hypothetical protein
MPITKGENINLVPIRATRTKIGLEGVYKTSSGD